jgi:hypothetical protein
LSRSFQNRTFLEIAKQDKLFLAGDSRHAYSRRQGEFVTRGDRRRRELKLANSSPSLARLRESDGVVTRWAFAEQSSGSQSVKPFLKLGMVNLVLQFEVSCFANYTTCPALLAPQHFKFCRRPAVR